MSFCLWAVTERAICLLDCLLNQLWDCASADIWPVTIAWLILCSGKTSGDPEKALKGRAESFYLALSLDTIFHNSGDIIAACRQLTNKHSSRGNSCNCFHIILHTMKHNIQLYLLAPSSMFCFVVMFSWWPFGCCALPQSLQCFNLGCVPDCLLPWSLRGKSSAKWLTSDFWCSTSSITWATNPDLVTASADISRGV